MRFSVLHSRTLHGINAPLVTIEANLAPGLPGFSIVGLPEPAIRESRDRIKSAIVNSGFTFPVSKIIINLAPADLPKEGTKFDLPIAISILAASNQISSKNLNKYEFFGELALNGDLRRISNPLPIAIASKKDNKDLVIPLQNQKDFLPSKFNIHLAENLKDVCKFIDNQINLELYDAKQVINQPDSNLDFADVIGQENAKRAITIACAGNHNILLVGPPGTGKTMLASRIGSILPKLTYSQLLGVAAVNSIKDPLTSYLDTCRPFRSPHHSSSIISIIGGGNNPKPGEISLAHNGVLFLDELPEFDKKVIESLREPLEQKKITIARAKYSINFPANFLLVAAMNPCPCGNYGSRDLECHCPVTKVKSYLSKISGPILDRIDLKIYLPSIRAKEFMLAKKTRDNISSKLMRDKVLRARERQLSRSKKLNSDYSSNELEHFCSLDNACKELLAKSIDKFKLPPRRCNKIIKVARTIADLDDVKEIKLSHIGEAISFNKFENF